MNPFEWHWISRAILSLLFVVPAWLSIGFFEKAYHIRGEVTAIWYFLGTALGTIILLWFAGTPSSMLIPQGGILLAIISVGFVFGSLANGLLFSAMASASASNTNPAIAQVIQGASFILVFLLSILLGYFFPKYFSVLSFNLKVFIGLIFVGIGFTIINLSK